MPDQATCIDEAGQDVIPLQPRVPVQNRLWTVPGSEHPENMLNGKSTAPDDRLPAEYPRVHRDASEEFLLGRRLALQGSSVRVRPQGDYSLAQRGFVSQESLSHQVSIWVTITLGLYDPPRTSRKREKATNQQNVDSAPFPPWSLKKQRRRGFAPAPPLPPCATPADRHRSGWAGSSRRCRGARPVPPLEIHCPQGLPGSNPGSGTTQRNHAGPAAALRRCQCRWRWCASERCGWSCSIESCR